MEKENFNDNIFDEYFDNMNLDEELKEFYRFLDDKVLYNEYTENLELTNIRNNNYKRYSNIEIDKVIGLPEIYATFTKEIIGVYDILKKQNFFKNDIEEAKENQKLLDLFFKYYNQLEEIIDKDFNSLEKLNNRNLEKIRHSNYLNVDKETLEEIINKYNEIVIFNSILEKNAFDNYKRQMTRKKYIKELSILAKVEIEVQSNFEEIDKLNIKINEEKENLYDTIMYLEDLMLEKSNYEKEFTTFKNYTNTLFAYDDKDYKATYNVYSALFNDLKIKSLINYFEDSFIKEREDKQNEERFVYEKFGIKNIQKSLDYISANYMDNLKEEEKHLVNHFYDKLNSNNYDLDEIYNRFSILSSNIWKKDLTDIKTYKKGQPFNFICTNSEFIDEKHEAVLLTDKLMNNIKEYSQYQIGFICEYNNNILYITENEDIMSVNHEDMSKLKTPKQLEQEYLNFKVFNKICLNGYITKIVAVYFIYDGDIMKYGKANQLAKRYNLPLIELKKDKLF